MTLMHRPEGTAATWADETAAELERHDLDTATVLLNTLTATVALELFPNMSLGYRAALVMSVAALQPRAPARKVGAPTVSACARARHVSLCGQRG